MFKKQFSNDKARNAVHTVGPKKYWNRKTKFKQLMLIKQIILPVA